jgi:ABC-type glycerol-3-phosphate transport system substrate-binding protein
MKSNRLAGGLIAAAALVAGTAITACGSSSSTAGGPASPGPVSTAVTSAPVTLTLATEDLSGLTQSLVKGFEKLHPNVKIKIETSAYNAYTASINLRLASSTPPDLSEAVVLNSSVQHHLLLNLDKYASLYHWTSAISPYALNEYRMGPTLKGGSGPLWAVSAGFDLTGLYYDKTLAARLGIQNPPTTLDEFNADLRKAKAAHITGLEVAANDGHAAFLIQQVADDYELPTPVNNWIFGKSGATFNLPGVTKGATALAGWAKSGYINASANATTLTQAVAAFTANQALFLNDGNWDAAAIQKGLGAHAGFAAFPAATAGGRVNSMVGGTAGYEISAKTKNPNVAAAFLNYSVSPQAAASVFASGNLPSSAGSLSPAPGTILADTLTAWQKVQQSKGLYGYYAGAYEAANADFIRTTEQLMGQSLTVPSFISQVQSGWAQAHTS